MTRHEFIAAAKVAALANSANSGLPAGITVAQAALESNWGQSKLSIEANNYFGIKAHLSVANAIEMLTAEVHNGTTVHVLAKFAQYTSMKECFCDRDRIILRVVVYAEARAKNGDPEAFAIALAKHWATDPDYADKILKIYHGNNFAEIDTARSVTQ